MTMTMTAAARSHALFVSALSESAPVECADLEAAIEEAVRAHHGCEGCTAEVAASYGDHPDLAVRRMRWAIRMAEATLRSAP